MKTFKHRLSSLRMIQDTCYRTCITLFILGTIMLFCIPEYREDWLPDFLYPIAVAADVSSGSCLMILTGGMIAGLFSFCLERLIEIIESQVIKETEDKDRVEMYLK